MGTCSNCQTEYKPLRKGRCQRCYQYWRAHGKDHPGLLVKCSCGNCVTCRSREAARRRNSGVVYSSRAVGRYKASELELPLDAPALAYIAGLTDGEGCITLNNKCWRVQIAMTDEGVIRWLGTFGGVVSLRKVYGNRKPTWRWLLMRQAEVAQFLAAIIPYMQVKRAEAEFALQEIAYRDEMRFIPRSE
jgi:hypothetical protein